MREEKDKETPKSQKKSKEKFQRNQRNRKGTQRAELKFSNDEMEIEEEGTSLPKENEPVTENPEPIAKKSESPNSPIGSPKPSNREKSKREEQFYLIESIESIKLCRRLRNFEYLVSWEGYPDSENSWVFKRDFASEEGFLVLLDKFIEKTKDPEMIKKAQKAKRSCFRLKIRRTKQESQREEQKAKENQSKSKKNKESADRNRRYDKTNETKEKEKTKLAEKIQKRKNQVEEVEEEEEAENGEEVSKGHPNMNQKESGQKESSASAVLHSNEGIIPNSAENEKEEKVKSGVSFQSENPSNKETQKKPKGTLGPRQSESTKNQSILSFFPKKDSTTCLPFERLKEKEAIAPFFPSSEFQHQSLLDSTQWPFKNGILCQNHKNSSMENDIYLKSSFLASPKKKMKDEIFIGNEENRRKKEKMKESLSSFLWTCETPELSQENSMKTSLLLTRSIERILNGLGTSLPMNDPMKPDVISESKDPREEEEKHKNTASGEDGKARSNWKTLSKTMKGESEEKGINPVSHRQGAPRAEEQESNGESKGLTQDSGAIDFMFGTRFDDFSETTQEDLKSRKGPVTLKAILRENGKIFCVVQEGGETGRHILKDAFINFPELTESIYENLGSTS